MRRVSPAGKSAKKDSFKVKNLSEMFWLILFNMVKLSSYIPFCGKLSAMLLKRFPITKLPLKLQLSLVFTNSYFKTTEVDIPVEGQTHQVFEENETRLISQCPSYKEYFAKKREELNKNREELKRNSVNPLNSVNQLEAEMQYKKVRTSCLLPDGENLDLFYKSVNANFFMYEKRKNVKRINTCVYDFNRDDKDFTDETLNRLEDINIVVTDLGEMVRWIRNLGLESNNTLIEETCKSNNVRFVNGKLEAYCSDKSQFQATIDSVAQTYSKICEETNKNHVS